MQVTFKAKEGNRDRWEIWIDQEKWREVHQAIFGKKPQFPPIPSIEELSAIFDAWEYQRVKNYVIWRLSAQSYHSEQLAKLLRERLVQPKTSKRVLQEYQERGLLDDQAWLQSFMRLQQKRYSLNFILSKLRSKGFSNETLQQFAEDWRNPEEEFQALQHLLSKYAHSKNLSDYKERQKVFAALARKGFSFTEIQNAWQKFNLNDL